MTNNINNNAIDITVWLNGRKKDASFPYHISDLISTTLRPLKESLSKHISKNPLLKKNFERKDHQCEIIHIYTSKEIDLQDYDIPYLKSGDILFITFDNSPFNPSNHYYQYEFVRWIKSGGYGKVFLGKHVLTQAEYAIKQINIKNFSSEDLYNISRENVILQSLTHKNIIKCYDSFAYEDNFFTIMDNAKGGELSTLLHEKGRLTEKEAKKIFEQVFQAVCFIHSKNIIHRDLKPNNILFLDTEKTHVVLIDFGISGFSNGNSKEAVLAGTTRFLPPEMASGNSFLSSPKLDIWAMGIILYRMVQGVFPFEGKNDGEIIESIIKSPLRFRKKVKISNECKEVISGMLEKNSKFRIGTDSDLFDNWFEHDSTCVIRSVQSMKQSSSKAFDNEFFFEEKTNSIGLNAYQSPLKSNIRQHISDYLSSVEQGSLKRKGSKAQSNKKLNLFNPLKRSTDIELPAIGSSKNSKLKIMNQFNMNKARKTMCINYPLRNSVNISSINSPTAFSLNPHTPKGTTSMFEIKRGTTLKGFNLSTNKSQIKRKSSIIPIRKDDRNGSVNKK